MDVVTLVMDGGTAYVLLTVLSMGIDSFSGPISRDAPRNVLIHAHDQIAGQLGMEPYGR